MVANLNALKSFVTVVDCGSVIAASRQCGYSPAAVSRQLGWLQRRLGVRLFVPDGRSIRPTAAALEFAARTRVLIEQVQSFERYSDAFGSTLHGQMSSV